MWSAVTYAANYALMDIAYHNKRANYRKVFAKKAWTNGINTHQK
jgi:hypothetical protein